MVKGAQTARHCSTLEIHHEGTENAKEIKAKSRAKDFAAYVAREENCLPRKSQFAVRHVAV